MLSKIFNRNVRSTRYLFRTYYSPEHQKMQDEIEEEKEKLRNLDSKCDISKINKSFDLTNKSINELKVKIDYLIKLLENKN